MKTKDHYKDFSFILTKKPLYTRLKTLKIPFLAHLREIRYLLLLCTGKLIVRYGNRTFLRHDKMLGEKPLPILTDPVGEARMTISSEHEVLELHNLLQSIVETYLGEDKADKRSKGDEKVNWQKDVRTILEKLQAGLDLVSKEIKTQIDAKERRLRYKEAYTSFADLIVQIANRTDLDNVKKGQMIHESAVRLHLES